MNDNRQLQLQIFIKSDEDSSWRQRSNRRMEELKNTQFSGQDAPSSSQPMRQLLHKDLVGKVMVHELYKAVENCTVDNFVEVLNQHCTERKLSLSDVFDQVTGAGDSLLHVAAYYKKENIVELISHHFPKLLIRRNVRGDTPLHVAVRSKNSTIVKFILSHYTREKTKHDGMRDREITRETNENGDTPLHEAIYTEDVDVIKEIFVADSEVVHCLNKSKRSPLYLGVVNGNVEILNLLLEVPLPADQPLPLCLGNSPLHAAILERKKPDLITEILKKRPELVYLRDEEGGTPLHYAAYIGYVEGFHILLQNSINSSNEIALEGNNNGNLPIHLACEKGHVGVVKDFLQHEWPINLLLNQKGQNILHVAAENGKSKVIKYLLKNSNIDQFTINQKDNDGNTPLHLASINLFPKVLYLITQDNRNDVNISNNNDFTARDIVHLKNQITIRKFLTNLVLKEAGVPVKVKDMLNSQCQQPPKMQLNLKDLLNTFLVVATLMVTVTFAAGFTVTGGLHSSETNDPKNMGLVILAHKPFWIFTTFNMIAMYSSVIACGLMLMALIFDHTWATPATISAMSFLVLAFLSVPIAFLAAVRLVVSDNSSLSLLIIIIGAVYTSLIFFVLFFVFFPLGIHFLLFLCVGRLVFCFLIKFTRYDDMPEPGRFIASKSKQEQG